MIKYLAVVVGLAMWFTLTTESKGALFGSTYDDCMSKHVLGNLGRGVYGSASDMVACISDDGHDPIATYQPASCGDMETAFGWGPCPDIPTLAFCASSYEACERNFAFEGNSGSFTCCFQYGPYYCADSGARCNPDPKEVRNATVFGTLGIWCFAGISLAGGFFSWIKLR